jgi:23S rRNA (uracil1939-C5)-methyltransferase
VPVFLPFTVPGDRVRARLGPRRGGGRAGRVVEWLALGPGRAEPPCPHFGQCGGCALQHLDRALYRDAKLAALAAALARVGADPAAVAPLQTLPPARRRARLGLARPRDPSRPARAGFRARFSHELIDLLVCPVMAPALVALVEPLRRLAGNVLEPGTAADLTLTLCDSGVDVLLEAPRPPGLDASEALAAFAASHDPARIVWRSGGHDIPIVERRPVRLLLSGTAVALPPGAFVQASAAAEALVVAEILAAIGDRRPALDLYSGLGAFAFALAGRGPVHAVEGDPRAAAALAAAARRVPGVTAECRDLDRNPLPPAVLSGYQAAVFDPPRAGALRQAAALAEAPLDTVVAVSCNPATFARDARTLIAGGFRLERLLPIDQFVWTPHLELVATFRR